MKRISFLCNMLCILAVMAAEGQSLRDTIHVREVNVLARRKIDEAGLKITRPDSMQRAAYLTADLSELLSDYTPVFIRSYGRGSVATASFRGAAASHTQLFWNGMNLNSPLRGIADLSLVPVYFTDGMYLLHGGSSMTRGTGALGGSIHLENNPDWNTTLGIQGMVETGSFDSRKAFLRVTPGNKYFQSSTRLFIESAENDFPFYNTGVIPNKPDTLRNAGYIKAGILQEFYIRHTSDNISAVRLWFQGSDRNLPQLMSYQGSERKEYQKDIQIRAQYDWRKYSHFLNYHFFTGINSTRLDYHRSTPEFDYVNEESRSRETGFLNHLRIFRKFDDETYATLSLDANYYEVNANNLLRDTGFRKSRMETSLMLNMHFKPSDLFALYILMRAEFYDDKMMPLIPSGGMEWQVFRSLPVVLRLNAARNFHKPTLNDLYWIPGGNPELLPEDGFTGDASLSATFSNSHFTFNTEVTGFASLIENWIIWQPALNGAYYWQANNIRDVYSRGIEYQFNGTYNLGRILFRSGGNYSFTRSTNQNAVHSADNSRNKQLIYIPKHKGGAYISSTWKKYTLKFDVSAIGKRYTTSSNAESSFEQVLNPYLLGKLTASRQFQLKEYFLDMKFTVDNLFDKSYQSILWRPMPGRNFTFTIALTFND